MYDSFVDFSDTSSQISKSGVSKKPSSSKKKEVSIVDVAKEYDFNKLYGGYFKNKK